jgi:hypothetical protein
MRRMYDVDVGSKYAGFCYDGPHEGQWHESETSMLARYSTDPLWWRNCWTQTDPLVTNVHQMFYRWSDPLRAWVCLNMR